MIVSSYFKLGKSLLHDHNYMIHWSYFWSKNYHICENPVPLSVRYPWSYFHDIFYLQTMVGAENSAAARREGRRASTSVEDVKIHQKVASCVVKKSKGKQIYMLLVKKQNKIIIIIPQTWNTKQHTKLLPIKVYQESTGESTLRSGWGVVRTFSPPWWNHPFPLLTVGWFWSIPTCGTYTGISRFIEYRRNREIRLYNNRFWSGNSLSWQ